MSTNNEAETAVQELLNEGFNEESSFSELLETVELSKDVIFTVPDVEAEALKKGLVTEKFALKAKMLKAGLVVEATKLNFTVYQSHAKGKGFSDVRVKLVAKKGVTVVDVMLPSDDL